MAEEVKPCPCCGSESYEIIMKPGHLNGADGWRVECAGACHLMTCWWHTREQALWAWNRRNDTSALRKGARMGVEAAVRAANEYGRDVMAGRMFADRIAQAIRAIDTDKLVEG